MEKQLRKIVIIGPESTGKSTLCTRLAEHYQTTWCPEYAREYLLKNGMDYSYDDLLTIAKGQLESEDRMTEEVKSQKLKIESENAEIIHHQSQNTTLLFMDTDMYVMKVWCEVVFSQCHPWILNQIATRKYDLYLLCKPDLPWVKDELREYPDLESRKKLYQVYKDLLVNQTVPWAEISGEYEQRLQQAIQAVDNQAGEKVKSKN